MRKKLVILLGFISFLIFTTPMLFAKVGIKAGLSLSLTDKSQVIYNSSKLFSPKVSIFYSINIGKHFSIQPELNFVRKGNRFYCELCEAEKLANLDYIEIPILLNAHLKNDTFDLFLGPYFGILIRSIKIEDKHTWTSRNNKIRKTDYGISLGARYHLFRYMFLELQFNSGFPKVIYDPNLVSQASSEGHKNRTLSFLIGLGF